MDDKNNDRAALECEITPEMIEAGLPHLYRYDPDRGVGDAETVTRIFLAMRRISEGRNDPSLISYRGPQEPGLKVEWPAEPDWPAWQP